MIGSTIGRYQVLDKLGQGGMGSVWKCRDTVLDRTVALKLLPDSHAAAGDARRRFLREARAASQLDHPGVARVYDASEIDGRMYIAIECVDGETVSELLRRGPLLPLDALRIAHAVAEALAHAHERGVLHRDVSSRNVMVARDGRVVLVDFGLALRDGTSRLTSSGDTLGTVAYLAPELILGRRCNAQSDVYGLGVVFYEMLTGTLPFRGERPEALLYATVNESLEPPSARQAGLPAGVDEIAARALAREPADRFPAAAAFAKALRALDEAVAERVPPATPRRPLLPGGTPQHSPGATPLTWGEGIAAPCYLAVIPFTDPGAGESDDRQLFSLGVTESVSAQLGRHPGLLVVPVPPEPGLAASDMRRLAHAHGADLILRGTVQRSGERLRLTWSLLDPVLGVQIAGDSLDGSAADLFDLHDRIVSGVVAALVPRGLAGSAFAGPASGDPPTARARGGLDAIAAQERYLQALGHLQRFDDEAQVDAAIESLSALRDGGHDSAAVEAALGRAYLYKHQITRAKEWVARAEAACRRALEIDPRSPDVLLSLGRLQRISGHASEAVRTLKSGLKLRPDHPETLAELAKSLIAAGKASLAEQTYYRALALRPSYWGVYNNLGAFYFNHGRYDRAVSMWQRVVELTPDNLRGHLNLGGAYFRMGRFEEAIAEFHRSIEIRPDASAFSNLGTVHYFLGRPEAAAAMLEKAVALRPADPRLWGNLGDAYRWSPGQGERAEAAFEKAIELMHGQLQLNPNNAESLGWLAEWMAKRGDSTDAVRTVRRALKLAPEDVNTMARAINVFHLAKDRAEALKWLAAALRLGYGLEEFERDPELASLRSEPGYASLVKRHARRK
jgi:serine/threonine-protein kinase